MPIHDDTAALPANLLATHFPPYMPFDRKGDNTNSSSRLKSSETERPLNNTIRPPLKDFSASVEKTTMLIRPLGWSAAKRRDL